MEIYSPYGIDFIYMINLDERPDRFARTSQKLAPFGIVPYRFSAVNGWRLSFEAIDTLGVYSTPKSFFRPLATVYRHIDGEEYVSHEIMGEEGVCYYSHCLSRGAIGILLSHLSCLQDALDSGYDTVWVMEDDIHVVQNPHILSRLIAELDRIDPHWDVLYTDYEGKTALGDIVRCWDVQQRPGVELLPIQHYREHRRISFDLMKIGMRYGAYSMIVRRSGMEKILNFFKTHKLFLPYDMDNVYVPNIRFYQPLHDIVTHTNSNDSNNAAPPST